MNIDGQVIGEVASGIVLVGGFFLGAAKWLARRTDTRIAKLEKERKESEEALRAAAAASERRCREEMADATRRIRELESRSHAEGRADRERLFEIVSQGAEANRQAAVAAQQASTTTATVVKALEKIAEHLPDRTPPGGTPT